jgi:hypothetical protein
MPLYHSSVLLSATSTLRVVSQGQTQSLQLYLQTAEGKRHLIPLPPSSDWNTQSQSLAALAGRHIVQIGLMVPAATAALDARLGLLEILP